MRKYLLPEGGNFYKANLHNHTNLSDGHCTPEEIKEIYKRYGYSIVAYTDHDIFLTHNDLTDDSFLALNGLEVEVNEAKNASFEYVKTAHLCFIALEQTTELHPCWHRSKYLFGNAPKSYDKIKFDENEPDFERTYSGEGITKIFEHVTKKGFFGTYNHPTWSTEGYEDYIGYNGMNAMEIFNGACIVEGFDDYNPRVYDDMLRAGKRLYCIGADDNHNHSPETSRRFDSGRAFTMIKADRLDYRTVTKALENGHFYASEAPEIYELYVENNAVHIKCSKADMICCNYDFRRGQNVLDENGRGVYEAVFTLPEKYEYFRITITDKNGKHACTNAYFKDALK